MEKSQYVDKSQSILESSVGKKPLWRIRPDLERFEFTNPIQGRELIDAFLDDIDDYTGSPDMWHTIAMIAGRVQHWDGRLLIIQAGLREWPNEVDLLCEQMQSHYSRATAYDPDGARQTWELLCSLGKDAVGTYWRYWVYGAIYHARELNDSRTAIDLLDEGLLYVRREYLMDIFRSYRRVLVDGTPVKQIADQGGIGEYQSWVLKTLEEKYKQGIVLSVEGGYVLATELAILYQEQAGSASEQNDYLEKALFYLDLAEKLYTGNSNHPIWDIYIVKVRIFMAQHRYGDALKILKSLPNQMVDRDLSLSTMKTLSALMTGEKLDETNEPDLESAISKAVPALFRNSGELLQQVIRQNPSLKSVLRHILQNGG